MGAARSSVHRPTPGLLADLLRPGDAAMDAGPVRTPSDVGGRAAWDLLVRDGALQVVRNDSAVPPGTSVDARTRAGLLDGTVPTGAVVAGRTAAWVHLGRGAPDGGRLDLTYPARGHRPNLWGAGLVWQAPLLRDDVTTLSGVRVTSVLRTVVDLALHLGPEVAVPRMVALVRSVHGPAGPPLDEAERLLERRVRAVGRPRARATFALVRHALGTGTRGTRAPGPTETLGAPGATLS